MKIVPFPVGGDAGADPELIAELEAALGGAAGPGARAWRELSGDIRSLAPPIDAGFQSTLQRRLGAPAQTGRKTTGSTEPGAPGRRVRRRWNERLRAPRALALTGAGALAALVIAVIVIGPFAGEGGPRAVPVARAPHTSSQAARPDTARLQATPAQGSSGESSAGAAARVPSVAAPALGTSSPRVQQLAAALTLGVAPSQVQQLADAVGRVATREGGYLASSQVQVEGEAAGGATLQLSLPSSRLARTLEALGRLAAVRAESQSQQDITDTYDAAKRALENTVAERAALLRALAAATTQAQIESLHQRLDLAGGAIARARSAFAAISSQAANAEVEVTILGERHLAGQGLTFESGLHDAGRVLTVAVVVLLVGLAGLIPLLAVAVAVGLAARALRRSARERVLGAG